MNKDLQYKISKLILADKNGVINEKEELVLIEWRNKSDRNEQLYQKLIADESFSAYTNIYREHSPKDGIYFFDKKIKKYKHKQLWIRTGYVATILIPICIAFIVFNNIGNDDVIISTITKGSSKAQLRLPDGRIFDLGETNRAYELLSENIRIEKDSLIYTEKTESNENHDLIIPRGGEFFISLSDGTKVWLNSESKLTYPASFNSTERIVHVEGEAYFDVKKDPECPFTVISKNQRVIVLGTCFSIRSYADEDYTLTTLESGKVKIITALNEVVILPGQQSKVIDENIEVKKVNTDLFTVWRLGKFRFENQSLAEILNTLSRWYDFDVVYTEPILKEIPFTGEFKRYENIEEWLKRFEMLEIIRYSINEKTVIIRPYN